MQPKHITDDLDRLLELLPQEVQKALSAPENCKEHLEVVLDLGRKPEARYPERVLTLGEENLKAVMQDGLKIRCRCQVGFYRGRASISLTLTDLTDLMIISISTHKGFKKAEKVRWFVSGDCDSVKLRDAIFNTSKEINHLIHYSYTKNLPLFLDVKRPDNYRLSASWGGRFDHLINPVDFS